MSNFWQRLITSIFFVAAIVGLTLYNQFTFLCLLMLIGTGALYEYYRIVFAGKNGFMQIAFIGIGVATIGSKYWLHNRDFGIFGMVILFSLTGIGVLLSKERTWKHIGYLVCGLFYVALPLALFYNSGFTNSGAPGNVEAFKPVLALNLFILIWCSDTFAYLCGRAFGKHKLFESVSPKKTWEGFIGGGLLTIGFSFLLAWFYDIPYGLNVVVALCTVVFGSLGDLVQSMLKREFDVKDSGTILPGHGGVLDRFDALLISLPFTTFCYYLANLI